MRGQARGACGLHVKELSVKGSDMRTRPRLSDEVTKCAGGHAERVVCTQKELPEKVQRANAPATE